MNGIFFVGGLNISIDGDVYIIGKGGSLEGEIKDINGIYIN